MCLSTIAELVPFIQCRLTCVVVIENTCLRNLNFRELIQLKRLDVSPHPQSLEITPDVKL